MNNLTKTKAKKSLLLTFNKDDKTILKQVKKLCSGAVITKTKASEENKSKYLLEFDNHKCVKSAKAELEKKLGKDLLEVDYPFAQMKKEVIKQKKAENKENHNHDENGEKPERKRANKEFEIKLPKLILRNLNFKMTEESLRKEMEKYGKVEKTSIPVKEDGHKRGFGFVQFSNLNEAKKALEDLNSTKKKLAGNKVIVDWCIPKNIFKRLETDSSKKVEEKENEDDDEEKVEDSDKESDSEAESEEEKKPKKKAKSGGDGGNKLQKKAKIGTQDVMEKRTVFLRNLAFDTTQEAIKEAFERFGPVKNVKICMDRDLDRPRGTGFVEFETSEGAENACAESNKFDLDFRTIQIDMAVARAQVDEIIKKKKSEEDEPKDKRNIALAKEGVIYPNSYEAEGVSKADMQKRQKIEAANAQKLKLLHFFVSPTRLSVHNIPLKCTDQQLREIFVKAIGESATGGKSLKECRIMRDLTRVNSEGVAKSKGYGFVEFRNHEMAMKALHATNNNPDLFENKQRLIVQFSIEDLRALKKKKERQEKALKNIKK